MSKIHLLFEYKKEKNKILLLFIKNITDFAYVTNTFLEIVKSYKQKFESDQSVNLDQFAQQLRDELVTEFKEKLIEVTYTVYVSMTNLFYYMHIMPHGKVNPFISEKVLILEIEDVSLFNKNPRDYLIDLASVLMPINFKFNKNEKHSDSILMSDEESIFYSEAFLKNEPKFLELQAEQNKALEYCEKSIKVKPSVVLVLNKND